MADNVEIGGFCDERFQLLRDVFAYNFKKGVDVGASLAVTVDGKFVVDMWAGYADAEKNRPWEKDTIVNVFSTTKNMTALCTLMLVDRGVLDLDAPVAKYWPEFAQAGKEKLPLRYLLSHTSGLSGYRESITVEDLYNWDKLVSMLASQEPWWQPGTRSGYHTTTFGYLLGEVIRRVTGKTIGTFFREEVAKPLKADFYIGLPKDQDHRVADLIQKKSLIYRLLNGTLMKWLGRNTILVKSVANPIIEAEHTTSREWRAAEIPAANGHGNARSVARIGSLLACGGKVDGVQLLSEKMVEKAIEEQITNKDLCLLSKKRWGLGFGLPIDGKINNYEVPNSRVFFWGGYGGSLLLMDLDARMSFSYVMNNMKFSISGDKRHKNFINALYKAI